jgi:hypothetical protein
MSHGKYLSLEEARRAKRIERFVKEHPTTGNKKQFDLLLRKMAKKPSKVE